MKYMYKEEALMFPADRPDREAYLVEKLNEFGQEGWRLKKIYPNYALKSMFSRRGGLKVLLEKQED